MMRMVEFGKRWEINTHEDYVKAMEILDENDFVAQMSDNFMREMEEREEVARQRKTVIATAKEKGVD